eukprot:CAMPEP_0183299088 /NCGR_PEP_ID=MMETSP0160_2-20130417/5908_1 /TAXON_ID=2839 ORGANISM="Odontella Sinensis, Strain Grunow 1884" /NCGR_SAMPLE_ID=MMETSP0160_2 /ASSEMBLY_ACC=CAM_ASM_000250 /LENGTH=355 /DNA_ID=CAMNT_0025461253 /DNA_START=62 /DNA_END=1126 /DNA_ORIENTATION=-
MANTAVPISPRTSPPPSWTRSESHEMGPDAPSDNDHDHAAADEGNVDFISGMRTVAGCGEPMSRSGIAIHTYAFNANMRGGGEDDDDGGGGDGRMDVHMYNSDGDFLVVPQSGTLSVMTELGMMIVRPGEICVLPRGIVFSVNLLPPDDDADDNGPNNADGDQGGGGGRGYVLEIFKGHFSLPDLGPIGSNGLANARDFLHPVARYESDPKIANAPCVILNKLGNRLFRRVSPHTPYNVVAWHGNYVPCKYDLSDFCAVNSVTYDHVDPSVYTVLTCRSDETGTALADFVVFPPRVLATDPNTFRPPWFHRNVMSEYMGLIKGVYDAKGGGRGGFVPGGSSLHNCMTPHGPDAVS